MFLQFEQEKHKLRVEIENRMELEKVRQGTEKIKLELQKCKLDLFRDRKLSSESGAEAASVSGAVPRSCDMDVNLRLLPKFNERDPDTFFTLFVDRILMLQCLRVGLRRHTLH